MYRKSPRGTTPRNLRLKIESFESFTQPRCSSSVWLPSPSLIRPGDLKKIAQGKFNFDSLFTPSRLRARSRALDRHSEREARAEEKQIRDRLDTLLRDLARIDRYERRALSRRRTAVRHLDELRTAARPDT